MAVARDHLRGDRGWLQSQALADFFFRFGADVAEGSDRAGNLAHAQILRRGVEAREIALHLVVPQRQLQAEGDGLGVHAVGAADLDGVFEFERSPLQRFEQQLDVLAQ